MIQHNHKDIIVLAYSGGLDTSAIIPWIKENYNYDVVAFVADIGQSKESLEGIREKAILSGAIDCHIANIKQNFVENYVFPMLQIGSIYENNYLLGTAISRPIIAKYQVEYANSINAVGVSHGATGKGNDQVRFEMSYAALAPSLKIIAPWREWKFTSREDLLKYLKKKNIPTFSSIKKIYSKDENIFHISTEGGILEDTWNPSNSECWEWTNSAKDAPDTSEKVFLKINNGIIVKINNEILSPYNVLKKLNYLGSKHSIGRIDIVENRLIGIKSRGCYETPGGTIIFCVLRALEQLVLDRDSMRWKNNIALEMSSVIYDGKWFTPFRKSLQSAANVFLKYLCGDIILELYKGKINILQRKSPYTLYSSEYATFGKDKVYNQSDAKGFIRLFSLSSRIRANLKNK